MLISLGHHKIIQLDVFAGLLEIYVQEHPSDNVIMMIVVKRTFLFSVFKSYINRLVAKVREAISLLLQIYRDSLAEHGEI